MKSMTFLRKERVKESAGNNYPPNLMKNFYITKELITLKTLNVRPR